MRAWLCSFFSNIIKQPPLSTSQTTHTYQLHHPSNSHTPPPPSNPGFTNLGDSDKVCMIKNSVYPLWLIYHSANYNLEDQEYNWFTSTNKERDLIMAYIRPLTLLVNHFKWVGLWWIFGGGLNGWLLVGLCFGFFIFF